MNAVYGNGSSDDSAATTITQSSFSSNEDCIHPSSSLSLSLSPSRQSLSMTASHVPSSTVHTNTNSKSPKTNRRRRGRRNKTHPQNQNQGHYLSTGRATSTKAHDAPMQKRDMYFALDCEMVGVGPEGLDSALARVSIINWDNEIVLDTYVTVQEEVTDYRTFVSGIRPEHIESESAMSLEQVRALVASILKGKILIGHALENDLKAVGLQHPAWDIRDTAKYAPFMRTVQNFQEATAKDVLVPKKLKELVLEHLKRDIQVIGKSHSPVEDSIAAMDLYKKCRTHWEMQLSQEVHRVQPQVSVPQPIPQPLQNQASRSPLRDMRSHFNNVSGGNQLLFGQTQPQPQPTRVPAQAAPSPQQPSAQFVVPMPMPHQHQHQHQHQHYNYNQYSEYVHPPFNHVHGHPAHGYMHGQGHLAHPMPQSHSSGRGKVTSAKRTQELARAKVVAALHQQRMKWQQKQQQQQQRQ